MKKILIKTGYSCNNNCLFCSTKRFKIKKCDLSYEEICKRIVDAKKFNPEMIVLSGGEVTIRKDFMDLVKFIKKQGLKSGVATNARMLKNKGRTDKLIEEGLEFFHITFLSTSESTHNHLVGSKGFKDTISGIENLKDKKAEVRINIVVNKKNKDELKNIVRIFKDKKGFKIRFSILEPIEEIEDKKEIAIKASVAARKIKKALELCEEYSLEGTFEGIPVCFMAGFEDKYNNLIKLGFEYIVEPFNPKFHKVDLGHQGRIKACKDCKKCYGFHSAYIKYYGLDEVEKEFEKTIIASK